jgi:hypothetical protein
VLNVKQFFLIFSIGVSWGKAPPYRIYKGCSSHAYVLSCLLHLQYSIFDPPIFATNYRFTCFRGPKDSPPWCLDLLWKMRVEQETKDRFAAVAAISFSTLITCSPSPPCPQSSLRVDQLERSRVSPPKQQHPPGIAASSSPTLGVGSNRYKVLHSSQSPRTIVHLSLPPFPPSMVLVAVKARWTSSRTTCTLALNLSRALASTCPLSHSKTIHRNPLHALNIPHLPLVKRRTAHLRLRSPHSLAFPRVQHLPPRLRPWCRQMFMQMAPRQPSARGNTRCSGLVLTMFRFVFNVSQFLHHSSSSFLIPCASG